LGVHVRKAIVEIFSNWKNIQERHPDSTKKFIISPLLASLHIIIPLLTPMNVCNKTGLTVVVGEGVRGGGGGVCFGEEGG
jgi:hypothetical protein